MTTHPFIPVTLDDQMRALRVNAEKLIAQANACADMAQFGSEHQSLRYFAAQVEDAVSDNLPAEVA